MTPAPQSAPVAFSPGASYAGPVGGIVLSGLSKSFGPIHAVRGIDVRIQAGETVALLGPNCAGKSTTIDM
ncbi:MAG TPA: ATP-binding cassette domain-containing protein, partial [Acidimicrobiales bacterium]|nr:ATP-binding cassette domain-containing protein [Acidimicrobiales bacterium]